MNVGEFFAKLSYGELSNLSVGMEGAGYIRQEDEEKVLQYTNTALKALYSRFPHKKGYVKLELVDGLNIYELSSLFAVSDDNVANTNPRYLKDSAEEPFEDDVVKILAIQKEDDPATEEIETQQLNVNVHPEYAGIKLLTYNKIYVPEPVAGEILQIEYQATHPPLTSPVNRNQTIELVPMLHEALEMRVAARVYNSMNGEANMTKAQLLMRRYEHLCLLVEQEDLLHETETSGYDKVRTKGFV